MSTSEAWKEAVRERQARRLDRLRLVTAGLTGAAVMALMIRAADRRG